MLRIDAERLREVEKRLDAWIGIYVVWQSQMYAGWSRLERQEMWKSCCSFSP